MKADHSSAEKRSCGPLDSFESRTAYSPLMRATSTQFPDSQRPLRRQSKSSVVSTVVLRLSRWTFSVTRCSHIVDAFVTLREWDKGRRHLTSERHDISTRRSTNS